MVKPLSFKGDKKQKKRKREARDDADDDASTLNDTNKAARGAETATASARKQQRQEDDNVQNDDSWVSADIVSDVSGPVLFVLPTEPVTALACDANGKVFTLPVENMVEDNPATAEPHDVRMVWVANRIAGTENHRFKGHHGKFLGCDKYGILTATTEAISPLESFVLIATADTPGTFQVQTLRDTYLTVQASKSSRANALPEVRGDATEMNFDTTLRIRMQARFKPRLRASKEEKAREKISRKELEEAVGRRLEEDEVKMLKKARREGDYHERLLDLKVKNKHDKYG
ncbi:actin-crosslinking protein [Cryphonectria parasitica EP155]|uniref:Actin-crosslinking protein n=1 Tax=Cryphonectria parasitica (strain ATCC 38755 / EP155) TaxID=660469 RepID=A0A9P5CMR5_CRYP1|nr:actin-crosslinking protein [Cryphonectria parasitica EP155]KAF3764403.1 actin-crosslinking protein [Cryphonectria parasitica EP155]